MKEFFYRSKSQRGPASRGWISAKVLDFRAAAEAVLGELTMFEPVADASAPSEAAEPAPSEASSVLEPTLEPIVCALAITQGASRMEPPIAPPPPASEPA